jgi:ABC-type antimicrobial peptide transport system permease subunit
VDRFAQLPALEQRFLRAGWIEVAALDQPVDLSLREQPGIFAEAREIQISLQQFLGFDLAVVSVAIGTMAIVIVTIVTMAIVERVDEIEGDVACD